MTCNIQSVLISHSIVTVHLKKIMRSNLGLIMNFYFLQILLFKLVLAFLMHWSVAIPNRVMSPKMKDLSLVHTTLWICCNLQQTVVLWVIRKFSNYSQHNLALCDSCCDLQLVWTRLYATYLLIFFLTNGHSLGFSLLWNLAILKSAIKSGKRKVL